MLTASHRSTTLGVSSLSLAALFGASLFSACSGGGSSSSGGGTNNFKVLTVSVPNNGTWQINRPIEFEFNLDVDFSSVNLNTINITQPNGAPAAGEFSLRDSHTVVFQPACPTRGDYADAGLLPNGVTYFVNVLGSTQGGPTVRSSNGRPLTTSQTVQFTTPLSALLDPTILFLDPQLGPPAAIVRQDGSTLAASYIELGADSSVGARRYFEPRTNPDPDLGADVPAGFKAPLNLYSDVDTRVAILVALNQPVDPSAANITPANIDFQFLQDSGTWASVPHTVQLLANCTGTGAQIRLVPTGILPQGRMTRVVLSSDFKDLIGQTNIVPTVVGAFEVDFATNPGTSVAGDAGDEFFEPFDVASPAPASFEDTTSVLTAPRAIWSSDGKLDAAFAFDGTGGVNGAFDWVIGNDSGLAETLILDTSFSVITNSNNSLSQSVVGGRVDIRSLWIKVGGTLVIQGPNPCRILCSGNIDPALNPPSVASVLVQGTIKCNGANNKGVVSFSTTNIPEEGAAGQAGGGDGGKGSFLTTQSTPAGGDGQGAFGALGQGGKGGESGFSTGGETARRGAGGGGGVFGRDQMERTRPTCPDQRLNGLDAEQGFNGSPTASGALHGVGVTPPVGGAKGTSPFIDANPNNDFWGTMVTAAGNVVVGELIKPHAGAGGGGGGDSCATASFPTTPFLPTGDEKGAGAGGGGGSLTILALGDIRIGTAGAGARARIEVNGGYGGGGENTSGTNRIGAGSGGGSGGHLVLQSASQIDITRLSTATTGGIGQGGLFARGGQGGAGANEVGGARATTGGANGETTPQLDALPPALAYGTGAPCPVVSAATPASDYQAIAANPTQFQITNNVGNIVGCGGDGGPGIIQFHTPTRTDILFPPIAGNTAVFRDVCFPLPVGILPTNSATPASWDQLLPIFGRRSFARSKWIPLGSASVAPGTPTPDQIRFLFDGTNPATGVVLRSGAGAGAKVLELAPILSANIVSEPAEPFITADKRTVVFDASALADDIYKRTPELLVGFALKMTSSTSLVSTNFDVASASYDVALDQLRVTIANSGAPLALYVNGDTAALIPRFFRVSTEGTLDSYPSSAEITIRFQGAPANSLGQPDEALASSFATNITTLNTTTFKFIRFQVEFDIQADGGSLSPSTPLPALEFLRIPFRF